jgi:hypothetical protein
MNYKFKREIPSSSPEIKKALIYLLKDATDISQGKFDTVLKKGALSSNKTIASIIVNIPIFQLSVNLNPQNIPPKCIILIGKPDEDKPRDRKEYIIPNLIVEDNNIEHIFTVYWNNWRIKKLKIDNDVVYEML